MLEDVRIQAAIIAAVVGIIGGVIGTYLKHYFDKRFLRHRLETEYEYEERKKLRNLIGLYHGRILLAAEHLDHRLWNLKANESRGWLEVQGLYNQPSEHYYFTTTAYRFANFLGLVYLFQKEALYIDSRIADGNELTFLKYAKSFEWVMTDVALFEGLHYDDFHQRDHFFVDNLRLVCDAFISAGALVSLDDFHSQLVKCVPDSALANFLEFFDGICRNENRLRWDRVIAFHLLLLAFHNTFGYDMQKATIEQFVEIAKPVRNKKVLQNLDAWLTKLGLGNDRGARNISDAIATIMSDS